jgi:hypothetical protein
MISGILPPLLAFSSPIAETFLDFKAKRFLFSDGKLYRDFEIRIRLSESQ